MSPTDNTLYVISEQESDGEFEVEHELFGSDDSATSSIGGRVGAGIPDPTHSNANASNRQPTSSPAQDPADQPMGSPTDQPMDVSGEDPDAPAGGPTVQDEDAAMEQDEPDGQGQGNPAPPSPSATALPTHPQPSNGPHSTSVPDDPATILHSINNIAADMKSHVTEGFQHAEKHNDGRHDALDQRVDRLEKLFLGAAGRGRSGPRSGAGKAKPSESDYTENIKKVFNVNAKVTGHPVTMDAARKAILRAVRQHLSSIFDAQNMDKFGAAQDPDAVREIHEMFEALCRDAHGKRVQSLADVVQSGPIPARLVGSPITIDYGEAGAGPKGSGYNQFMAKVFVADFFNKPEHANYDVEDIREAFFDRIKNLKAERAIMLGTQNVAAELRVPVQVVERQLKDMQMHESRRRRNHVRRVTSAEGIPDWADPDRAIELIVKQVGTDGGSDDEDRYVRANGGRTIKQRVIKVPAWRAAFLRALFSDLEDLYFMLYSRDGLMSQNAKGQLPEPREFYDGEELDWDASPVPLLPHNAYNSDWLQMKGSSFVEFAVRPTMGDPFVVPPRFREYYLKVQNAWQELHPVQPRPTRRAPHPSQPGPSAPGPSKFQSRPHATFAPQHPTASHPAAQATSSEVPASAEAKGKRKLDERDANAAVGNQ
ncbi:unnamed protein product [Peniophora sp. CBMAI 1063]|nr:unnamed protein product [Peniophora sp. CBMAI 1063]